MATIFEWSGKTSRGVIEKGEISANSREEVIEQLKRRNLIPTRIKPKRKKPPSEA